MASLPDVREDAVSSGVGRGPRQADWDQVRHCSRRILTRFLQGYFCNDVNIYIFVQYLCKSCVQIKLHNPFKTFIILIYKIHSKPAFLCSFSHTNVYLGINSYKSFPLLQNSLKLKPQKHSRNRPFQPSSACGPSCPPAILGSSLSPPMKVSQSKIYH